MCNCKNNIAEYSKIRHDTLMRLNELKTQWLRLEYEVKVWQDIYNRIEDNYLHFKCGKCDRGNGFYCGKKG